MQEDSGVDSGTEPSNTNQMGSYIPYVLHPRRTCSTKLYALRTGRHGGQREQRLSRPSLTKTDNLLRGRSARVRSSKTYPLGTRDA